jgi:hypothetical protein
MGLEVLVEKLPGGDGLRPGRSDGALAPAATKSSRATPSGTVSRPRSIRASVSSTSAPFAWAWASVLEECRREDSNLHSLNGNQVLNLMGLPRRGVAVILM